MGWRSDSQSCCTRSVAGCAGFEPLDELNDRGLWHEPGLADLDRTKLTRIDQPVQGGPPNPKALRHGIQLVKPSCSGAHIYLDFVFQTKIRLLSRGRHESCTYRGEHAIIRIFFVSMTTNWSEDFATRIASAIKSAREAQVPKLSVAKLSERTGDLGFPMSRTVISDLELGRRRSIDVAELAILAAALEIPPVALLYPDLPDGRVEALPGFDISHIEAVQWFSGEKPLEKGVADFEAERRRDAGVERVRASRELDRLRHQLADAEWRNTSMEPGATLEQDSVIAELTEEHRARTERDVERLRADVERLTSKMRASGWTVTDD